MIEAELKARVQDVESVQAALSARTAGKRSNYEDTYYDLANGRLSSEGRELRLRTITANDERRSLLTYKEPAVDAASGSKPEQETEVADAAVIDSVLRGLGLTYLVRFEKHCVNYRFASQGHELLATLVTVPELDGTFIELETMVPESELAEALEIVRTTLYQLGIADGDLTTEQYTDAVLATRRTVGLP
ncbi:class IV adenylate cyclase [Nocardia abscessus]|uniref:class IV adenylate cyclase n=1 Tax=Nocardia abscessus TaxID=120957 RepID=UPI001894E52D|nr:class IV adenylate cyclase [Nocardia abscessus]MBF6334834.1 class IV adenylate cyclase [Nocardia abscessus]